MKKLTLAAAALGVASTLSHSVFADDSSRKIQGSQEAVEYVFERDMIPDRETTRLVEFFDRFVKGDRTWTMTFLSDQDFLNVKFDETTDVKILRKGDRSSLYSPELHNKLPKMQDNIGSDERLEEARQLLQREFPDATIEDDYITQFRFCFAPPNGETSRYRNGCRRKGPVNRWKVWLKMSSEDGDWVAKEVFFADDLPPVIKPGPRGYFE